MDTRLMDDMRFKRWADTGRHAKSDTVMYLLHTALATEFVCVLRYKRHYFAATGSSSEGMAQALRSRIQDDLVAQRMAIESHRTMIRRADDEPASRRMLEGLLASEEEHAEDLTSLLKDFARRPE